MGDRNQRKYGQDQPWREERRQRYPDEPYGGGYRGRQFSGPEGYGEHDFDRDRMDWNESRWNRGASFGFGAEEDIERGGNYAYGENYSGRGPKDYRRSDDRIREDVCDRFTDDARLDASEVTVKVEACEVTLTGSVATRDQKRRAEEIAERVRGVNDVHNQLRVVRSEAMPGMNASAPPSSARGSRAAATQSQSVAHDRDRERER